MITIVPPSPQKSSKRFSNSHESCFPPCCSEEFSRQSFETVVKRPKDISIANLTVVALVGSFASERSERTNAEILNAVEHSKILEYNLKYPHEII